MGWTWLGAGYGLHRALFGENILGLYISQGKDEASDMISKARYIWENLPDFLRISLNSDQRSFITFGNNHSELRALPSTAKAGRGSDATFIWRDETSRHEYAKDNFASIGPAIDAGGQLIDGSTLDKLDPTSHFTDRVNKALRGESNAHFVFLGWRQRPVRDENLTLDDWWNKQIKPKYSPFEIEQEYPETLEDALKISGVQAFFSEQALNNMLLDCCEPLEMGGAFDTFNGIIKIYKLPVPGAQYCIFTDPSDGVADPHATIIIDWQTGEQVAESHGKVPVELCAEIHDKLVRFYNKAFNSYEVNAGSGGTFADVLKNLGTPSIAPRRKPEGELVPNKLGLYTTEAHKKKLFEGLEEAVRNRRIRVHNQEAIGEFRKMIRPEGEPMPRVVKNTHDDYVMAWAGVWYTRKYMPPQETAKVISMHYKQVW